MKLFLYILLLIPSITFCQEFQYEIGLKAGMNYSSIGSNSNYRYGYHAGGFIYGVINPQFRFGAELQYSNQGAIIPVKGSSDIVIKYNYASISFIGNVNPMKQLGLSLHTGLQFGYLMNQRIEFSNRTEKDNHPFESNDFALVGGIGYRFKPVEILLRYTHSIEEVKNQMFQLSVYYTLFYQSN